MYSSRPALLNIYIGVLREQAQRYMIRKSRHWAQRVPSGLAMDLKLLKLPKFPVVEPQIRRRCKLRY